MNFRYEYFALSSDNSCDAYLMSKPEIRSAKKEVWDEIDFDNGTWFDSPELFNH